MNYGHIKYYAVEDGPGCRTAVFVSGCRHHCKGCFQPQTWDFKYGKIFDENVLNEIINSLDNGFVSGLTILGGEPFEPENQPDVNTLVQKAKETHPEKTIWIYTGCMYEDLINKNSKYHTKNTDDILKNIDVLVDGPFILKQRNLMLRFKGSENQRIIDIPQTLENKQIVLSEYNNKKIK